MGRLILSLILLLDCSAALAFGATGHRVIGQLAEQHLTAEAAAAIKGLLDGQSLALASTWADEMRSSDDKPRFWGYDYSANWHFANIPPGQNYRQAEKNPAGDAYTALLATRAILENRPVPAGPVREGLDYFFDPLGDAPWPAAVRRFALLWLVHLVEDLHQPLHLGHEADRGGNDIQLRWFGAPANLHQVWDTRLVEHQGQDVTALSRALSQDIERLSPREIRAITGDSPPQWIDEALAMRSRIYDVEAYDGELGENYASDFVPVVERQLLKAGLRLATLLNEIFAAP